MATIKLILVFISLSTGIFSFCQSNIDSLLQKIDLEKWPALVEKKAGKLRENIIAKSQKTLDRLQKQEEKVYRKGLNGKDSLQAKAALADIKIQYQSLRDKLKSEVVTNSATQYISKIDTLVTALKFLDQNGISGKVKDALSKTQSLQNKFQQAEEIRNFIRQRRQQLKEQLEKLGLTRQLKKFSKEYFYYNQQLKEYAGFLQNSKKAERKALALLSQSKWFKEFFKRNSHLASLFRLPGDPNDPSAQASLAGLQTRTMVNGLIQSQLSSGGPGAMDQFRQNLSDAQNQLNQLKNKVNQFGGSSSDDIMPEGFRVNPEKTRTFIQRIQVNADLQTTRHNKLFPVNSDLGLSAAYKLNANSKIFIGSSFKIGWGTGFNDIRISTQGFSFRGGLDWRLKGNLFIAGNYEQNYFSAIGNVYQLRDYNNWKEAALLGLSKQYTMKKGKSGEIKILYDFFYNHPPVRTQPVIVRFAWNIK
ncbi:MAG TPA: hypothetical protein VI461_13345 [Chitinophagaceae bacterium]|nr:hypothetical protein [Chitinophagaceae bacterium]